MKTRVSSGPIVGGKLFPSILSFSLQRPSLISPQRTCAHSLLLDGASGHRGYKQCCWTCFSLLFGRATPHCKKCSWTYFPSRRGLAVPSAAVRNVARPISPSVVPAPCKKRCWTYFPSRRRWPHPRWRQKCCWTYFTPRERTRAAVKNVVGPIRPTPGSASERAFQFPPQMLRAARTRKMFLDLSVRELSDARRGREVWGFESGIECACPPRWFEHVAPMLALRQGIASTHIRV